MTAAYGKPATIAAVVVAFNPQPEPFGRLLRGLAAQVDRLVVVDNSVDAQARAEVAREAEAAGAALIAEGRNLGVARAQNLGVEAALRAGARYVLLSDDDSEPAPDMVSRLIEGFTGLAAKGRRVAAVGPLVHDPRLEGSALAFGHTWIGPRRIIAGSHGPAQAAAFLVASGCLLSAEAWREVGPMREDLFIDHVDLEWGLRARHAGFTLFVVPGARLNHRLGDRVARRWFRAGRVVHIHAPMRNYYLTRNTLVLLRGPLLPAGWRVGYAIWLAKYIGYNCAFVRPRRERVRAILRGLRDALAGRLGPAPSGVHSTVRPSGGLPGRS